MAALSLWLALPQRRKLGIAAVVLGTLVTWLIYHFLVPGPNTEVSAGKPAESKAAP